VSYSGGDGLPQGVGVTAPGRDSQAHLVMAQSCGVRALSARTCEQERGRRVRGDPRARQTSPEGAFSPRARRTSPEGAFSRAALAGHGGRQGCVCLVCAFLGSWISSRFVYFMSLSGFPPVV
jgi:uncharacterized MAPEG superfamily protein